MDTHGRGRGFIFGRFTSPQKESVLETQHAPRTPEANNDNEANNRIPNSDPCTFCNRRVQHVLCRACGHLFAGRARIRCPDHQEVIHLMDYEVCPNCLSTSLKEFAEVISPRVTPPSSDRKAMLPRSRYPPVGAIPVENERRDY